MTIVYFFIGYLFGLFATAFTIVPVLIILFFALPLTKKIRRLGYLKDNQVIKNYLISLILLSVIFILLTWATARFLPVLWLGFIFSTITMLLFNFKKFGMNYANFSEYMENNAKYFSAPIEEVVGAINI